MKAYTDYPITELGDKPNTVSPVRLVNVISYDGDKYCKVEVEGVKKEIKSGYLYAKKGRLGEVPNINFDGVSLK